MADLVKRSQLPKGKQAWILTFIFMFEDGIPKLQAVDHHSSLDNFICSRCVYTYLIIIVHTNAQSHPDKP